MGQTNYKGTPVAAAMNVIVEAARMQAEDIDQGYFFDADFHHHGLPIGRYRVLVQRIGKIEEAPCGDGVSGD